MGGFLMVVSMKFKRTPLLHSLLDFLQFWQSGAPSSHLRCRSLQVKQPVRTLFGLAAAAAAAATASAGAVDGPLLLAIGWSWELWPHAWAALAAQGKGWPLQQGLQS